MLHTHHFFRFKDCSLHYVKVGNGKKTLLLFHGFGQDHLAFEGLADELGTKYNLYVFDLFFHGKSEWNYGEAPLEKSFWKELLAAFLLENSIERFSLAGYSLGARFVFASLECCPQKIDALILLAPDGIKTSSWYNLATYPIIFRKLFKSMILHPARFHAIANAFRELYLIDKGLLRFAESQMNTEEKRKRVYYSWVVLRHFTCNTNHLAELITKNSVDVTIILGKFDKVITPKSIYPLTRKISGTNIITTLSGHNNLIQHIRSERLLSQALLK